MWPLRRFAALGAASLASAGVIRIPVMRSVSKQLRPVGSIAWKLACVACGDGDLNISVAPKNEWDVCAGDLLVREAGGIYVDFEAATRRYNQANPLIDKGMAAGPQALLERFLERHHQTG